MAEYTLKYGKLATFEEGDQVLIIVRSELHKAPNESELVYRGRITEIENDRGFWFVEDSDPEQEEFLAFQELENVLARG